MILRAAKWRIACVFGGGCIACLAQSAGQQTQTGTDSSPTFSTAVNLVIVPVVVRDANGNAVGTLRREDFRLYDRGKLQTVAKFVIEKTEPEGRTLDSLTQNTAVANSAAPSSVQPVAQHFVALLFDDVHLSLGDLAQARAAAVRMFQEPLNPGTRYAVITTSGRVTLDFTGDRDKLSQAVNQVRLLLSGGNAPAECSHIGYYQADRIVGQDDTAARFAAEVAYAMNCLHPGPKEWPGAMVEARQAVRVLAQNAFNLGRQASEGNLAVLRNLIQRMAILPGTRSIVLVSPGFFVTDDRHDLDEGDVTDRAIRADVVISALSTHGVAPSSFGDVGVPLALLEAKNSFEREQAYVDEGIMQQMAESTGGTFFHNDNDYYTGLRRSAALPEYTYILGFAPQNLKSDGSFHKLKVTLRSSRGLQLQARRGYVLRSNAVDAAAQVQQQLKDALFSRDQISDLPVELITHASMKGDQKPGITVVAHIDLKGLHFRKADGLNRDTLTVISGVFDQNGKYVTGRQKTVDLKLTDASLNAYTRQRLVVESNLDVSSGSYVVRLVVRDSEGAAISTQNSKVVEVP